MFLLLLPLLRETPDLLLSPHYLASRFPVSYSRSRSFLSDQFFLTSSTALMTWVVAGLLLHGHGVGVSVSRRLNCLGIILLTYD